MTPDQPSTESRHFTNCDELLQHLNELLDGTFDSQICQAIEEHLRQCKPCQIVVDTLRKTIAIYRQGRPIQLPEQFRKKLHEAIRTRWKDRHTH